MTKSRLNIPGGAQSNKNFKSSEKDIIPNLSEKINQMNSQYQDYENKV